MKKVLVLMLVLGMASLANADLMYQIGGVNYAAGSVVNVGTANLVDIAIVNTAAFAGPPSLGGVFAAGNATSLTGSVVGGLPGTWSTIDLGFLDAASAGMPYDGYMTAISNDVPAVGTTAAATLFTFSVGKGTQNATFEMFDTNGGTYGSILLTPEPATMLILGLGGLLLRRK